MPIQFHRPRAARARAAAPAANRPYANPRYVFNPTWPAILSVAHDEADGAGLFVITDRPCHLVGSAFDLPLTIDAAGGSPLAVVSAAVTAVPIKFRLAMSGAVPRGQAWSWGPPGGAADLFDPITGHALNAGAGDCADFPGPYTPPPPANVVSSSYGSMGMGGWATLTFDQPVILTSPSPTPDDAITFVANYVPTAISADSLYTLRFALAIAPYSGASWSVNRQPAWVSTLVSNPATGNF